MDKFTYDQFDDLFSQAPSEAQDLFEVFDTLIKGVPIIDVKKLADIPDPIRIEQIYRLSELPSVDVISRLSEEYYYGGCEIGIVGIRDCLLLIIACIPRLSAIELPSALKPMERKKLFKLDFHSHSIDIAVEGLSENDYSTNWPGNVSFDDLTFLNNTIKGQLGIGEFNGLISLTAPSTPLSGNVRYDDLKFGTTVSQVDKLGVALTSYKQSKGMGHIDPKKFPRKNLDLRRDFLMEFFEYRLILWENKIEIEQWFRNQLT